MEVSNQTFVVASLFPCELSDGDNLLLSSHPIWRQTLVGCEVLMLLQAMYPFNIKYQLVDGATDEELRLHARPVPNSSVDVYVKPLSFRPQLLDYSTPIQYIYSYRMGFLLRRPDLGLFRSFYYEPFHASVWRCLFAMAALSSLVLFICARWERIITGRPTSDCGYFNALFVTIAACCQRMPHVFPALLSRRIAILTFSLYVYVVHSYYTSNLLSHLVSDRNDDFDLDSLYDSPYTCVVLDSLRYNLDVGQATHQTRKFTKSRLQSLPVVDLAAGVSGLRDSETALLSDYATLYPLIMETFTDDEICQLSEIDVFPKIHTYLFTSKTFSMMEEFKQGILRLLENGILRRTVSHSWAAAPSCLRSPAVSIQLSHVVMPLAVLGGAGIAAGLLLVAQMAVELRLRSRTSKNLVLPGVAPALTARLYKDSRGPVSNIRSRKSRIRGVRK